MSNDERRLSDEIRDAKAALYSLLLLSSETKVYNLSWGETMLFELWAKQISNSIQSIEVDNDFNIISFS